MTSYPFSNVLLPAVFISSAVFSTLTLPFALIKEPMVVELPFFSGEIQPIFNGEHKEVAIPYVGFAIVVSVGAGIASVEVNRRWQAYRESAITQEPLPNLQQDSTKHQAEQDSLKLPEYRPEVSAIDFSPKADAFTSQSITAPNAITEAEPVDVEAPEQLIDATQLGIIQPTRPEQTKSSDLLSENQNLLQLRDKNNSVHLDGDRVSSQSTAQDLDLASSKILESREHYQTCRIKVPHLERRLFAILVNEQYYSFLRAEKTKDDVLEIMASLGHRLEKTIITKTEKGYVIWNLEPEALPLA